MSEIKIVRGIIPYTQASEDTRVVIDDEFSVIVPKGMVFSTDQDEIGDDRFLIMFSPVPDSAELDDDFDMQYGTSQIRVRFNTDGEEFENIIDLADPETRSEIEDIFISVLQHTVDRLGDLKNVDLSEPPFVVKSDATAVVVATVQGFIGNAFFYFATPTGYHTGMYRVAEGPSPEAVMEPATYDIYKKTAKRLLGTIESTDMLLQKRKETVEDHCAGTEAIEKTNTMITPVNPISENEITYDNGFYYQLQSLSVPIPDGTRYIAHRIDALIPNGSVFSENESRYGLVCYLGETVSASEKYKDARFGFSVLDPVSIELSSQCDMDIMEMEMDENDLENLGTQVLLSSLQDVDETIIECVVDRVEKNYIILHSPATKNTDENEYWESFRFVIIDWENTLCYRGTIFINAPFNRNAFDSIVSNLMKHFSFGRDEKHSTSIIQTLGDYANGSKIDAIKAVKLYQDGVFWTNNNAIFQNGHHNRIKSVDANATEINKYPDILNARAVFSQEILKLIKFVEENEDLVVPCGTFHDELCAVSRDGSISGTIWFEFLAWNLLKIAQKEKDVFMVFVDNKLLVGIPNIYKYIGEFLRTLRDYNGEHDDFTASFLSGISIDVPCELNCMPVPGAAAQVSPTTMIHFCGKKAAPQTHAPPSGTAAGDEKKEVNTSPEHVRIQQQEEAYKEAIKKRNAEIEKEVAARQKKREWSYCEQTAAEEQSHILKSASLKESLLALHNEQSKLEAQYSQLSSMQVRTRNTISERIEQIKKEIEKMEASIEEEKTSHRSRLASLSAAFQEDLQRIFAEVCDSIPAPQESTGITERTGKQMEGDHSP